MSTVTFPLPKESTEAKFESAIANVESKENVGGKRGGGEGGVRVIIPLSEQARQMALESVKHKGIGKQTVLPEAEYVSVLTHIIRRDFFPDLHSTLEQEPDIVTRRKRQKTSHKRKRGHTWEGDSSEEDESEDYSSEEEAVDRSKLAPLKKLSLNVFQQKFTSEDNASFAEILANDARTKAEKTSWIYEQQCLHDMNKAIMAASDGEEKKGLLSFWDYKVKNHLMYYPEGEQHAINQVLQELQRKHSKTPITVHDNTRLPHQMKLAVPEDKAPFALHKLKAISNAGGTPMVKGHKFVYTPMVLDGSASPITTWGTLLGTPMVDSKGNQTSFKIHQVPYRDRLVRRLNKKNAERIQKEKLGRRERTPATILQEMSTPSTTTPFAKPSLSSAAARLSRRRNRKRKRSLSDLSPAARKLLSGGSPSIFSTPSPGSLLRRSRTSISRQVGVTPSPANSLPGSIGKRSRVARSISRSRTPKQEHEVLAVPSRKKLPRPRDPPTRPKNITDGLL